MTRSAALKTELILPGPGMVIEEESVVQSVGVPAVEKKSELAVPPAYILFW